MNEQIKKALQKVEKLLKVYHFTNELGEPITFVPGQKEIIAAIINLGRGGLNRVQIETPTQYGKSAAVAAAITMLVTKKLKVAIVAGTGEKAQIIMDYVINFTLENEIPRALLDIDIPKEKLKRERSRRRLTFSSGFEVRVYSADARNKQATGNAIMGFGAPIVIEDEAALVDDVVDAKIARMVGGFSTTTNLLVKIGNPFYRNHFYETHRDPNYHLIWIDYRQGLREGRFTPEFIEEMRKKPAFDVLYEVKFPPEGAADTKGWVPLLSREQIKQAMVKGVQGFGINKLGIDVAGGGRNYSVIVQRFANVAKKVYKSPTTDTMEIVEEIIRRKRAENIRPRDIFIDKIGVGQGAYDLLNREIPGVHGVKVSESPPDDISKEEFVNLRAYLFWKVREWILKGGKLEEDEDWYQLANLKYRVKLEGKRGKMQIISKEDLAKDGIPSPDVADALALTFLTPDIPPIDEEEHEISESAGVDPFNPFPQLP